MQSTYNGHRFICLKDNSKDNITTSLSISFDHFHHLQWSLQWMMMHHWYSSILYGGGGGGVGWTLNEVGDKLMAPPGKIQLRKKVFSPIQLVSDTDTSAGSNAFWPPEGSPPDEVSWHTGSVLPYQFQFPLIGLRLDSRNSSLIANLQSLLNYHPPHGRLPALFN